MCIRIWNIDVLEFHVAAAWTLQRVMAEGKLCTEDPALHDTDGAAQMALHQMDQLFGSLVRHGIKAVIAEHVESFFWDMDDQLLNEIMGMLRQGDGLVIFMAPVPVGHMGAVIGRYAGLCHDGPADIPGDVFCNGHGGVELVFGRGIDVEPVRILPVKGGDKGIELWKGEDTGVKGGLHVCQQGCHPLLPEHGVREVPELLPFRDLTGSPLGDEHMDVRVPFQVTAEGMQCGDHARPEVLLMVLAVKPVGEYLGGGPEEDMEEAAVLTEVGAQLLRDGEDNMAVPAVDELEGDGIGTVRLVGGAAGVAETAVAAERDEFVCAAVRAYVEGAAEVRVTAVDSLLHLRPDNRADIWIF
ncbi:hypothetical protein OBO34_10610 [Clostridiales Family XIII bacterium ASD5510]|uniref:Uncharacterized protein n=1 Tax=Hominibacterium faecale TaxID=2839743 RepID=A0A9J6QS45_9FIRM|nr:hypothetical protein [Hominibacterium faecale]MCU7378805.1 hypothetical protein [Hominibacterium faecale]